MRDLSSAGWEKLKKKLQEPDPPSTNTEFVDAHNGAAYLEELKGFDPTEEDSPAEDTQELLWPVVWPILSRIAAGNWDDFLRLLDSDALGALAGFLDEHKNAASAAIGRDQFVFMRASLGVHRTLYPGRRLTRIDGPMHLGMLRSIEAEDPFTVLSYRQLGELLGVSHKTIKQWEERMIEAGPPPTEGNAWLDYFHRIVKPPRGGREPP